MPPTQTIKPRTLTATPQPNDLAKIIALSALGAVILIAAVLWYISFRRRRAAIAKLFREETGSAEEAGVDDIKGKGKVIDTKTVTTMEMAHLGTEA